MRQEGAEDFGAEVARSGRTGKTGKRGAKAAFNKDIAEDNEGFNSSIIEEGELTSMPLFRQLSR